PGGHPLDVRGRSRIGPPLPRTVRVRQRERPLPRSPARGPATPGPCRGTLAHPGFPGGGAATSWTQFGNAGSGHPGESCVHAPEGAPLGECFVVISQLPSGEAIGEIDLNRAIPGLKERWQGATHELDLVTDVPLLAQHKEALQQSLAAYGAMPPDESAPGRAV